MKLWKIARDVLKELLHLLGGRQAPSSKRVAAEALPSILEKKAALCQRVSVQHPSKIY